MENKKIEYKKNFFINEINEKFIEISHYLATTNNTKYYTEILEKLNSYKNISINDKLDELIDNFIGISNLLRFIENEQLIAEIIKNNYEIPVKA